MARGIKYGSYHTSTNFGLSMTEEPPRVGSPQLKENYIDIPGGIPLDASEYPAGHPTYGRRTVSCKFVKKLKSEPWPSIVSTVMNAVHGRELDIILDDDPAWIYHGRVKVNPPDVNKSLTALEIIAECLPYKTYRRSLKDEWIWDQTDFGSDLYLNDGGLKELVLDGSFKTVYLPYSPCEPDITATVTVTGFGSGTSGFIRIASGRGYKTLNITEAGTYSVTRACLFSGANSKPTVSASNLVGTLTIDYTPRSL